MLAPPRKIFGSMSSDSDSESPQRFVDYNILRSHSYKEQDTIIPADSFNIQNTYDTVEFNTFQMDKSKQREDRFGLSRFTWKGYHPVINEETKEDFNMKLSRKRKNTFCSAEKRTWKIKPVFRRRQTSGSLDSVPELS